MCGEVIITEAHASLSLSGDQLRGFLGLSRFYFDRRAAVLLMVLSTLHVSQKLLNLIAENLSLRFAARATPRTTGTVSITVYYYFYSLVALSCP